MMKNPNKLGFAKDSFDKRKGRKSFKKGFELADKKLPVGVDPDMDMQGLFNYIMGTEYSNGE